MAKPAARPVTTPDPEPTVAISELPLVHAPPPAPFTSVMVWPAHTLPGPVTGVTVVTVTTVEDGHPSAVVYTIVAVPVATPLTAPPVPTAATAILLLAHVPPGTALNSVVENAAHVLAVPVLYSLGYTVKLFVALQPSGEVKEMAAAPADRPDKLPVAEPMAATDGFDELHVPVVVAVESVVLPPRHNEETPDIAAGTGYTVAVLVDWQPGPIR